MIKRNTLTSLTAAVLLATLAACSSDSGGNGGNGNQNANDDSSLDPAAFDVDDITTEIINEETGDGDKNWSCYSTETGSYYLLTFANDSDKAFYLDMRTGFLLSGTYVVSGRDIIISGDNGSRLVAEGVTVVASYLRITLENFTYDGSRLGAASCSAAYHIP